MFVYLQSFYSFAFLVTVENIVKLQLNRLLSTKVRFEDIEIFWLRFYRTKLVKLLNVLISERCLSAWTENENFDENEFWFYYVLSVNVNAKENWNFAAKSTLNELIFLHITFRYLWSGGVRGYVDEHYPTVEIGLQLKGWTVSPHFHKYFCWL
jgi:hypothetical protein